MGLYRGWRWGGGGGGGWHGWGGGGGLSLLCPSLTWIRVCMRIMPLCVSVEFLCLSI